MTFYDLTEEYMQVLRMAEDPEVDETALRDTLEGLSGEIEDKVDGYCGVIAQLSSDAKGLDAQIARMAEMKASLERNIRRMKQTLQSNMELIGKPKVKTPLFSVWIQKNVPSLKLDVEDPKQLPAEYLIPQDPKINTQKIKDELKAGEKLPFARLEQSASLRIR
ncbi:siphovirus Gp157 family protein [Oribacterium sp. oral taxon 102]|uniref:siphovirus Gp157 family protein n=1 Tax=Oribacterium sp. oral taxon 102 TaxID=671214 RepID=UPI0015BB6B14|nr:siphovirus Gp157 family protein [Oribacterium sp. oral taxon 102]NWO21341.1 siphovirus Gp157 family protein [Oribacterium sp. oral taxon 102]